MINEFRGKYSFLSNFWMQEFKGEHGEKYPSVEHYFQCHKATNEKDFEKIRSAKTSSEAKKLGKKIKIRTDWDDVKEDVMFNGVYLKFYHNLDLRKQLTETYDEDLIEGNDWNDTFWGVDLKTNQGMNKLGKILMKVRDIFVDLETNKESMEES